MRRIALPTAAALASLLVACASPSEPIRSDPESTHTIGTSFRVEKSQPEHEPPAPVVAPPPPAVSPDIELAPPFVPPAPPKHRAVPVPKPKPIVPVHRPMPLVGDTAAVSPAIAQLGDHRIG